MPRLLVALLCLLRPDAEPEPGGDAKAHAKKMQGTWSIVRAEGPDKPPDDFVKKAKFVFGKGSVKITGVSGDRRLGTFKLALKKGVGQIDIQPPEGSKPVLGLYKFEKDRLILCCGSNPGDPRPAKFGDPKAMNLVLKKDAK